MQVDEGCNLAPLAPLPAVAPKGMDPCFSTAQGNSGSKLQQLGGTQKAAKGAVT